MSNARISKNTNLQGSGRRESLDLADYSFYSHIIYFRAVISPHPSKSQMNLGYFTL